MLSLMNLGNEFMLSLDFVHMVPMLAKTSSPILSRATLARQTHQVLSVPSDVLLPQLS